MAQQPVPNPATTEELAASLARLGVRELEERMELSPLLTDPGVVEPDACECSCRCDDVPPDPEDPLLLERIANTRPYAGPAF